LGSRSPRPPAVYEQLASQHAAYLARQRLTQAFEARQLQARYPQFNYRGRQHGTKAVVAPFAIEAIRRNLVRCVGFTLGGLDTHDASYRHHAHTLQEMFDLIAVLVKTLDATPHPTLASTNLGERTHIRRQRFCRTPQVNPHGGRDHY
jgi:hypothetical protein